MAGLCCTLLYNVIVLICIGNTYADISCMFDEDACGWHSAQTSTFQWRNNSGQTDDTTSGPLNDHTCQNYLGYYMYISGSDIQGNIKQAVAILESPPVTITKKTKLTFWYLMKGFGVGTLKVVQLDTRNTSHVPHVLWEKQGRQSPGWKQASVEVVEGDGVIQLVATVRLPYSNVIAVDDMKLEAESPEFNTTHCILPPTTPSTTTTSTTSTTTTTTQRPTTTFTASNLTSGACLDVTNLREVWSCNFENSSCGMVMRPDEKNKNVLWRRNNQLYKYSEVDHIRSDHTFETQKMTAGYYMQFKNGFGFSSWRIKNPHNTAQLETPSIQADDVCFTFWYNMPTILSNLAMYVRDKDGNRRQVWTKDAGTVIKGRYIGWQKQTIPIHQQHPFTIVFETYNHDFLARVGIDDISISESSASFTNAPLPTNASGSTARTSISSRLNTTRAAYESSSPQQATTEETPSVATHVGLSTVSSAVSAQTHKTSNNAMSSATKPVNVPTTSTISAVSSVHTASSSNKVSSSITKGDATSPTASNTVAPSIQPPTQPQTSHNSPTISSTSLPKTKPTPKDKHTKKPAATAATKKPIDDEESETDKQKDNSISKSSTIVGAAIGGLVGLVVIVIVVYTVCSLHSRRQQRLAGAGGKSKHVPAKFDNNAFNSNGSITNGKTHMNGSAHVKSHPFKMTDVVSNNVYTNISNAPNINISIHSPDEIGMNGNASSYNERTKL